MVSTTLPVVPRTYAALRVAVGNAIVKGQQAAELAKVRTYHETGRLIREHLITHAERADYGAKLFLRLATDLELDRSVLQRCDQFYRAFPICATWHKLTWAHYRVLIPVTDPMLRKALATEANRNQWPVVKLAEHIRTLLPLKQADSGGDSDVEPLTPKRGTPGICRVIDAGDGPVGDLGFASYLDLSDATEFAVGDFVRFDRAGRISAAPAATKADLFTYEVTVLKVVDGDTLWVKIYLRPRQWVKQKLRLRDLDCPEMNTAAGQVAKRFVAKLMAQTKRVTICTSKPDKYDRYLADVFLALNDGSEVYLNNELLAKGHAVRMSEYSYADWGY